jgi:hypothetical protein
MSNTSSVAAMEKTPSPDLNQLIRAPAQDLGELVLLAVCSL